MVFSTLLNIFNVLLSFCMFHLLQPLSSSDGFRFRLVLKVIQKCVCKISVMTLKVTRLLIQTWDRHVLNCRQINIFSFSCTGCHFDHHARLQELLWWVLLVEKTRVEGTCQRSERESRGEQDDMPSVFCHLFTHTHTHEHTAGWWAAVLEKAGNAAEILAWFLCLLCHNLIQYNSFAHFLNQSLMLVTETSDQPKSTEVIKHVSVNNWSYSVSHGNKSCSLIVVFVHLICCFKG